MPSWRESEHGTIHPQLTREGDPFSSTHACPRAERSNACAWNFRTRRVRRMGGVIVHLIISLFLDIPLALGLGLHHQPLSVFKIREETLRVPDVKNQMPCSPRLQLRLFDRRCPH